MAATVMVITRDFDPTADLVITRLAERGAAVFRFDLADFPSSLRLSARCEDSAGWDGVLRGRHRHVDLGEITAAWYRKPTQFQLSESMSVTDRQWSTGAAKTAMSGLFAAMRCRWVNHPHRIADANHKPYQLAVATDAGLDVPDTLITNDPGEARAFCAEQPAGVITKPLHRAPRSEAGERIALYTTPVETEEITGAVALTAHLFQARVSKRFEVRLTVVGGEMYAARIDARTPAGRLDWRADHENLTYQVIDVPSAVAAGVRALMARLGLVYGALDFAVDRDGRWWFLEVNPNGQWGWLHEATDLPIADALADTLTEGTR